jgi:hypothetical protein
LLQYAAALRPKRLESQYKFLKRQRFGVGWVQSLFSGAWIKQRL